MGQNVREATKGGLETESRMLPGIVPLGNSVPPGASSLLLSALGKQDSPLSGTGMYQGCSPQPKAVRIYDQLHPFRSCVDQD